MASGLQTEISLTILSLSGKPMTIHVHTDETIRSVKERLVQTRTCWLKKQLRGLVSGGPSMFQDFVDQAGECFDEISAGTAFPEDVRSAIVRKACMFLFEDLRKFANSRDDAAAPFLRRALRNRVCRSETRLFEKVPLANILKAALQAEPTQKRNSAAITPISRRRSILGKSRAMGMLSEGVAARVLDVMAICPGRVSLIFNGTLLCDGQSIGACGITDRDSVCIYCLPGKNLDDSESEMDMPDEQHDSMTPEQASRLQHQY
mmetsp:Transcript_36732/g.84775  ORF Transcript_36732/g.84775 Transcript_36732/m.84775 type:complete len:262 (+) Transcript_36732:58-843(+)